MNQLGEIAAVIAARLARLRGTQHTCTTNVGDAYVQAASYEGDDLLIEISAERFLPRLLPIGHDEELLTLGFTAPSEEMPNWWIGIEGGSDADLKEAALSTVCALVGVYGFDENVVADAAGVHYLDLDSLDLPPVPKR